MTPRGGSTVQAAGTRKKTPTSAKLAMTTARTIASKSRASTKRQSLW
jgi:hypothetical protein